MRYLFWLLTGALFICVASCGGSSAPEEATQTTLATAPVTVGNVTRVVNASGTIVPRDEVMVGSEVSGRILQVAVDFNSRVAAGDTLAIIDPQSFQNRVRQLQSRLEAALADTKVREASINRAEVNLSQAETVLSRQENLFAQNAVSQARLDEALRSVGVARADLKLARAQLESTLAQVNQIRAELATANLDLERTVITSPIDGVIIDRKVDPGQTVQASFSAPELFALAADLSDIRVEAQIVESDVAGLDAGDKVKFTVDAYPDLSLEGTVEQLRLKSQEANNIVTYVAVVAAKNEEGKLMPGMTANLEITTDIKAGVTRIPAQADRFRPTPDQIARWQADGAEVASGPPDPNAAVYSRLERVGMTGPNLDAIKETLTRATAPLVEIINDPQRTFLHTPTRIRLSELTDSILSTQLSPADYSAYRALLAAERSIRDANLWIKADGNKMQQVPVKLGLSDGAFIEVVSGLEDGTEMVVGIRQTGQGGGRPGGGPGGRPGGRG
ncbi:MAG: efflux RND transporter periplasmic adaptor subunit [Pseudomonadota bacterium]